MAAQQSRFTVHGLKKQKPEHLGPVDGETLPHRPQSPAKLARDLRILGIGPATAFPDLDGLAQELAKPPRPALL